MQSPTDIAGGSRIPKSQHGQRMTFHLPVLTFLYADPHYVPHRLHMPLHDPVISCKSRSSYGAHVLDHLAADGAGDPFLDIELPQMILEHHAEAAPFM